MMLSELDFTDGRLWLEVLVLILTTINTGVVWLRKPGEEAKAQINLLSDRVDDDLKGLSIRLQSVEERMKHIPTDEELAQLAGDVQTVKAVVEGQASLLRRVEHQQTLILEQLLSRAK